MKLNQKKKEKSHLAPLHGPRPFSISCCLVAAALTAASAAALAAAPAAAPAFDFWLLVYAWIIYVFVNI